MIDVRMFTVGPVQENCFIVREKDSGTALIVDPGDEAERLLRRSTSSGSRRSRRSSSPTPTSTTSAPWRPSRGPPARRCTAPSSRRDVLANIMDYVPWPGFGPFESYEADHTVAGGETLELAGIDARRRSSPPGHSPGHVTYAIADEARPVLRRRPVPGLGRDGSTCPAATGRRCWPRSSRWSTLRAGDDRLPGPHGDHDARSRARHQPVPARARER